jgi:hypothetical protein
MAGGAATPFVPQDAPGLQPEPLVRPPGASRGLTPKSQDVVKGAAE